MGHRCGLPTDLLDEMSSTTVVEAKCWNAAISVIVFATKKNAADCVRGKGHDCLALIFRQLPPSPCLGAVYAGSSWRGRLQRPVL